MTQAVVFDATILIVAYRSRGTIERVMQALADQTVSPTAVCILENGSPEGERVDAGTLPRSARLIVSEQNLGFAAGNNRLAREAKTRWLILLNPDAFPEPDWLEQLSLAAERYPDVALFGSTQWVAGEPGVLDGAGDVWHAFGIPYRGGYGLRQDPPEDGEVFAPCGAAMMIRRDVFEALGGFDEDYFCYVEDVDLGYRARLAGHRCVQLRRAVVHHIGYASSGRRSPFATYHGTRNRLWTFLKNTPLPWLLLLVPLHAAATGLLWVFAARSGQAGLFGRAILDGIRGWPRIAAKRRREKAQRIGRSVPVSRYWVWDPRRLRDRSPALWPLSLAAGETANSTQ